MKYQNFDTSVSQIHIKLLHSLCQREMQAEAHYNVRLLPEF
jgi:hypothetical protein